MSKTYRYIVLIFFLAFLGFIIYPLGILPVKNIVSKFIYPLSGGVTGFSNKVSDFFLKMENIKDLSYKNEALINENLDLKSKLTILKDIEHENQILKEEFGFLSEEHDLDLINAQIIGRSPSGFSQNIKIKKGSDDGIKVGNPVISHGFLIGIISQISSDSSEILLITSSNSLIPVILQESRGTGLLQGGLQGLQAREIPIDVEIKSGESVLTSGLGGDIKSGLPIGTVEKVISKESEIFQKISVSSPIDFNRLEIVFIIK